MKVHKFYIVGAALVLGMYACTVDKELEYSHDGDISFSANVGKMRSRVLNNQWEGDEQIGVSLGENTASFKAYSIATDGTMSTTEEPYQWEGTPVNITAWTPLTDQEINLTDQTTEQKLYDCDLLFCQTQAKSKEVHLQFNHQMTKMLYMLQGHGAYTDEEAKNARIYFLGYRAVTYTKGIINPIGDVNTPINPRRIDDTNGEAIMVPCEMWDKPLIKVEIGGDTHYYTPRKSTIVDGKTEEERKTGVLTPGAQQKYYIWVDKKGLTVNMESSSIGWDNETIKDDEITDSKFKVVIPEEISILAGYSLQGIENDFIADATHGFSITYTKSEVSDGIDFEGMCDRERSVAENNITFTFKNIRSDIKLTYTTEYMEVGYYLYNNGTYGEDYKDGETAGVIFKVGKHETDDVVNYDGRLTKIHGYAVALTDEENASQGTTFKWKNGNGALHSNEYPEFGIGGGNTTQYIGYQNTKYLIEKAVSQDRTTVPAASTSTAKNASGVIIGTSGWYLPSHTQLKDLESLAGFSGQRYTALNGTYWDSSFDSDANAYIVVFGSGVISSTDFYRAVDSEQKVRLILTF